MQVDQPLRPQRLIQRRAIKMPATPLAPRPHKATEPCLHIPVDLLESYPGIPKIKVIPPAVQKAVNIANHFLDRGGYPPYGHVVYLGASPFQALFRGDNINVPTGSMQTAILSEGKTKEVKAAPLLLQINRCGFVSIQDQVKLSQRLAFSVTLTTPALYRRSLRWFEASTCMAAPRGRPSSFMQHSCTEC